METLQFYSIDFSILILMYEMYSHLATIQALSHFH
jgi:hypothetical protein